MRKGARRNDWSTKDLRYLRDNAGVLSIREICKHLKRSRVSVEQQAKHMHLSLRCFKRHMQWCPVCATWRSSISDRTGQCRVCAKRKMYEDGETRVSQALANLTLGQRIEYDEQEARRGTRRFPKRPTKQVVSPTNRYKYAKAEESYLIELEAWEIKCLDLRIDANKSRLKRIRKKLGTNPRKNS